MKIAMRVIAVVLLSPVWLAGAVVLLPLVILAALSLGAAQLANYAVFGEWMKE